MKKVPLLIFIFFVYSLRVSTAQHVIVSGAVAGDSAYMTLSDAFSVLNASSQTDAVITIYITGDVVESTGAVLNQNSWKSLSISPSGGKACKISGDDAVALLRLNGADNVVIDGLNVGANSLTLENTNISTGATIQFLNDAQRNAVKNTTILGASTNTSTGTIYFSTAETGGNGNDTILFKSCIIDASSAGTPVNAVFSEGSAIIGQENNTITFDDCAIANFYHTNLATNGIWIAQGNTEWIINNCKFYQSASRIYTSGNVHRAIYVSAGNNYKITGNLIGYASINGTGIYTMSSPTIASRFIAIDLSSGTDLASSLQNNTISGIALTSSAADNIAPGVMCGINIAGGNADVGTLLPNIIGGTNGSDLFMLTSTTENAGMLVGISSASTNTITIKNNIIGGLTAIGNTPAQAGYVVGIAVSGLAKKIVIDNNTIGNSTAHSIRAGISNVTTASSQASGILFSTSPDTTIMNYNTIQNISSFGTSSGFSRGIFTAAAASSSSVYTINHNTIFNITTNSSLAIIANGFSSALGIGVAIGTNVVIHGNTVYNISNTNTGNIPYYVVGIAHAYGLNSTISNNTIYNLSSASTASGTPSIVTGILIRSGANEIKIYNNTIALGAGQNTNTTFVGILGDHGPSHVPIPVDRIYFNTIHISGTASSGASPSFGFMRGDFTSTVKIAPIDFRNNIVTNTRNGGTGKHYAIGNNYGTTATVAGWPTNASNYNVLNANATTVGYWNGDKNFANWKSISASDTNSYSGITVNYVDPTKDLHLDMGTSITPIESGGVAIVGINNDIDNQVRPGPNGSVNGGGIAPDIGADEFDGVWADNLGATITYTPIPSTCFNTNRTLLANITDLIGIPISGDFQPRIYYKKNTGSWFSSPGTLNSGTATNGNWTFTILVDDMGGLNATDVVSYFVIAQDIAATPNISATPFAGLIALNVNTILTAPVSPATFTVQASPITISINTLTHIKCYGETNGVVSANVNGTVGYPQYIWSNGATTHSISDVVAGSYTLQVTDMNGCSATQLATITSPAALTLVHTQTDLSCNNSNDGSISIFASGGTSNYSYSWASIGSTTSTVTGLSEGNYTVTVTDANMCSQLSIITIANPPLLTTTIISQKNLNCYGLNTGEANVIASGGTGLYSYLWSAIGSTTSNVEWLSAGTYTLLVTDTHGCSTNQQITIASPAELSMQLSRTNISCNNANDGAIAATVIGGTAPYDYLWTTIGSTTSSVNQLHQGTYALTVTDGNGCSTTSSIVLTEPSVITLSATLEHIRCFGDSSGQAMVSATGGNGSYTYMWATIGATNDTVSYLRAGTYTVTVKDTNNCSAMTSVSISEQPAIIVSTTPTDISCYGANDGKASVSASGGTESYTYLWTSVNESSSSIDSLSAGVYTVTVTDSKGCSENAAVSISEPPAINLSASQKNITCYGANNGEASVSVSGGNDGFTYVWTPNVSSTSTANNLNAGTYTITSTSTTHHCPKSVTITILEPDSMVLSTTQKNISCFGGNDGEASVSAGGGTGTYSYLWEPVNVTTATVNNLSAGSYSVTVTDDNNCSQSNTLILLEPALLAASVTSVTHLSCHDVNDGSINLQVSGGTGPYLYHWSKSELNAPMLNDLPAGIYSCMITDKANCSASTSATVTAPDSLDVSVSVTGNMLIANAIGTSFQWVDCANNYAPIAGANNASYMVTTHGNYAVIVSAGICSDTSDCNDMHITGLANSRENSISVYPNPSNDQFNLELLEKAEIIIYNAMGEIIENKTLSSGKHLLMLPTQGAGLYYLHVQMKKQQHVIKLIKY